MRFCSHIDECKGRILYAGSRCHTSKCIATITYQLALVILSNEVNNKSVKCTRWQNQFGCHAMPLIFYFLIEFLPPNRFDLVQIPVAVPKHYLIWNLLKLSCTLCRNSRFFLPSLRAHQHKYKYGFRCNVSSFYFKVWLLAFDTQEVVLWCNCMIYGRLVIGMQHKWAGKLADFFPFGGNICGISQRARMAMFVH